MLYNLIFKLRLVTPNILTNYANRELIIPFEMISLFFFRKSAKTLYMSGLHIARNNSKLWNNAGHMFFADNDMSTALQYFKQGTMYVK